MADTRPFVVEGLDAQQERRNPGLPVVYVGQSLDPVSASNCSVAGVRGRSISIDANFDC